MWDLPSVQQFGADIGPVILNLLMVMGADSSPNEVTKGCFKERNAKNALRAQDGNSAPKLTGNNRYCAIAISSIDLNDPTQASVVVFGVKLLHSSLKRSKLDWDDERVRTISNP